MKSYIYGVNYIRLLRLLIKLFKFEIRKCGQISCAHKPCFLMLGHIYRQYNHYIYLYSILLHSIFIAPDIKIG